MKTVIRRALLLALIWGLAACTVVSKVEKGEAVVRDRLVVQVDDPWNRFERDISYGMPTWTQEGITVDAMRFLVGVADGQPIAPTTDSKQTPLLFRASMQPAEIAALYQALLSRDGSTFTLTRIEPDQFIGTRGLRIEYELVRKVDDVRLKGVAWAAVHQNQLFMIAYDAPRLAFFDKYIARATAVARSARVRG